MALHGMELVYMDKEPTSENISDITVTKTILTAGCRVETDDDPDGEEFGFSVHVSAQRIRTEDISFVPLH